MRNFGVGITTLPFTDARDAAKYGATSIYDDKTLQEYLAIS